MALTADECDAALAFAADKGKTLVVYQNRRFDRDFITMRRLIREGSIGDVFQYDSFVGGYSRPCDYWHSDADVSGGAIFDWGSHYLDQVLNIFDAPIEHVSGMNHKRKWLHATNADHAEVIVTFNDGRQATFVHSDLAAARKPKYYVLGTEGAIVGQWDAAAEPAVADLPARIFLFDNTGASREIPLDEVTPFTFHAELAAYLTDGTPMQVDPRQSRNVVSVMEAAEESATNLGRPVTPHLGRMTVRWGILGAGWIVQTATAQALRDAPSAHLAAVGCSRTFLEPKTSSPIAPTRTTQPLLMTSPSTPSTSRSRTISTLPGSIEPSTPANTCCVRSR